MEILELFKLVQKYPCTQTISILLAASKNMSISGVHLLFQYDIVGFLQKIILSPEKILVNNKSIGRQQQSYED